MEALNYTSRRAIPVLLVAATLVPIAALGWLAVRILQQERDIEAQRAREGLRYSAAQLALAVNARLAAAEEQLAQGHGILFGPDGLETRADSAVLYQPSPPHSVALPDITFASAEALEFQRRDLTAAAREYARLAESRDPAVRAAALVRLGAVLRKQQDSAGALRVYARLQELGSVPVDGQPAGMIARQARCRIYELAGDGEQLRAAASELARTLYAGSMPLDQPTFLLYRDMLRDWGAPPPPPEQVARTEAAIALWRDWRAGTLPVRGRKIVGAEVPVLAVWTGGPDHPAVWLAPPAAIEAWLGPLCKGQGLAASLYGPDGDRLFGPELADAVALTPGETHLPFMLRVAFVPRRPHGGERSGRNLLLAGLLLTFAVMLAAAYGLYRATAREMALARQQSEFVSTVSHEFRTPLTSMRHLTELLATGSVPSEERKATYYQLLARETERLHRMVESLLSFGRMQAGAYAWRLEQADARQLVRTAVEEFRREPHSGEREVICDAEDDLPPIQADREALSRAVSNLLENAEKYSEPGTPIHVRARRAGSALHISLEDRGFGIPAEEQKHLFGKFVRGSQARRAGIRGIGVGLALVKSVAEAHGGSVELASEPGRGSTFTLVIPCRES
jgi:signal transduction histidine kinase